MSTDAPNRFKIKNARLSFPALWKPRSGKNDKGEANDPRFESTFILDETAHAADIAQFRKQAQQMLIAKYGQNYPKGFKLCLRRGDEEGKADMDGYGPGKMFIPTSSKQRPQVVHRDPNVPVAEADGVIYAGCYVNASIRLWIQDNSFGKRINAEVLAVQFYKDGERFGDAPVNAASEFDNLDDGDGAGMLGDSPEDDLSLL